ncbi:RsmB/NOP family class I SAM-dependent RNA methyltransferase [Tropicimonas sp. S265A]|uniref:RsmB/NOP family class I SAM-dependent RNA methyltransferase n=1 Tax=Tropicimonas sp. S265A TaxID=3415134 RepID=UPI003C7C34EF
MTPAARVQAAIDVLDQVLDGAPAERALTRWARSSRFAGSKDRAAVRDHVFDALRRRESAAWAGGGLTGRGLMLGVLRLQGVDPSTVFTGAGYGPAPLSVSEASSVRDPAAAPEAAQHDVPAWMLPLFKEGLGKDWRAVLPLFVARAPLDLRVNTLRVDLADAQEALALEGVETRVIDGVPTALRVTRGARHVARSRAFAQGLVEVQDASSQAAVLACGVTQGAQVMDYCAGGGGKALALAALSRAPVMVHDVDAARMGDIPIRAERAGALCPIWDGQGRFDLVFVDAPCSGSGTWRRAPDAKWRLTPDRLAELTALQAQVLNEAAQAVAPGGRLAYATCSVFADENGAQVTAFCAADPAWSVVAQHQFDPRSAGDGFFLAILERQSGAQQL